MPHRPRVASNSNTAIHERQSVEWAIGQSARLWFELVVRANTELSVCSDTAVARRGAGRRGRRSAAGSLHGSNGPRHVTNSTLKVRCYSGYTYEREWRELQVRQHRLLVAHRPKHFCRVQRRAPRTPKLRLQQPGGLHRRLQRSSPASQEARLAKPSAPGPTQSGDVRSVPLAAAAPVESRVDHDHSLETMSWHPHFSAHSLNLSAKRRTLTRSASAREMGTIAPSAEAGPASSESESLRKFSLRRIIAANPRALQLSPSLTPAPSKHRVPRSQSVREALSRSACRISLRCTQAVPTP